MSRRIFGLFALVTLLAIVGWQRPARAAGWTPPAGDGYAKVWGRAIFGGSAYTADGGVESVAPFRDVSLRYYLEYGVTDEWTALTYGTPVGWASYDRNTSVYAGSLALGVRRELVDGPFQLAVQADYGYRFGAGGNNLADPAAPVTYRPTIRSHVGRGELQFGKGFGWGWMSVSAGAQWFSNDAIDLAIVGGAEVGYSITDSLDIQAHLGVHQPLGEVIETNVSGAGQTRYVGFGAALSWWFAEPVGLSIGVSGAALTESNASTPSFTVGAQAKF